MPRPTKLILEEAIPVIEVGIKNKQSKIEIARRLGVSRNTLHHWIATAPEIKALFKTTD